MRPPTQYARQAVRRASLIWVALVSMATLATDIEVTLTSRVCAIVADGLSLPSDEAALVATGRARH